MCALTCIAEKLWDFGLSNLSEFDGLKDLTRDANGFTMTYKSRLFWKGANDAPDSVT